MVANQCILVADDEPDVVSLLRASLAAEGFEVVSASDGPTTLDVVRIKRPALVILDLVMPGMSGLEVCKVLKQNEYTARIPILMLTGRAADVDKVVAFELGVDD